MAKTGVCPLSRQRSIWAVIISLFSALVIIVFARKNNTAETPMKDVICRWDTFDLQKNTSNIRLFLCQK